MFYIAYALTFELLLRQTVRKYTHNCYKVITKVTKGTIIIRYNKRFGIFMINAKT